MNRTPIPQPNFSNVAGRVPTASRGTQKFHRPFGSEKLDLCSIYPLSGIGYSYSDENRVHSCSSWEGIVEAFWVNE